MKKFLEYCAEVEEVAALIYRELAQKAAGNERLQEIMRKMAADEEDHARQLRFATRVSTKDAFDGINEKVGNPYLLKPQADRLLAQVKSGEQSEYDILKTAVELENKFRSIHAGCALLFKEDSFRRLFNALARADQLHMAELDEYIKQYKQKA